MNSDSNSLVLEVSLAGNQLRAALFDRRDFSHTLRRSSRAIVFLEEIDRLNQEVISVLKKWNEKGRQDEELLLSLKKTGRLLWDNLLPRPVKEKLQSVEIRNLILYLDEELIHIPWELLFDGEEFLCLKFNLGRQLITREDSTEAKYRQLGPKVKMLIIADPTGELSSAYREGLEIKNQLDRKLKNINVDFKSSRINKLDVKRNLPDYDIVHFAGHCEYDISRLRATGLVFNDGCLSPQEVLSLTGKDVFLPCLVFSNACNSAKQETIDPAYQQSTYSLASSFLLSGVRHYIGAVTRINDTASALFAREFYSQLSAGASVGESLKAGRIKLIKIYGLNRGSWTNYILYGDPSYKIFSGQAKAARRRPQFNILRLRKAVFKSLVILALAFLSLSLYYILPTINPNVYFRFMKAERSFQRGQNEISLAIAEDIVRLQPDFLEAYPLLAEINLRLGNRSQALRYYFEYALQSEKKKNMHQLAAADIGIGWVYQTQGEYEKSHEYYTKALSIASSRQDALNEAKALRKLALWYMDKYEYDKALELLTKSSEINRTRQQYYSHRYNLACDYFDMGLVFTNKNDFVTAQQFYTKSRKLFEKMKLKNELSDCYFNQGEIYLFNKEYHKAMDSYMKGLRIDLAHNNKSNLASDYNMIGELYVVMDDTAGAGKYFRDAILVSKEINAMPELAAAYHNLGLLYKHKARKNKAREYLRLAQEIYFRTDQVTYRKIQEEIFSLEQ